MKIAQRTLSVLFDTFLILYIFRVFHNIHNQISFFHGWPILIEYLSCNVNFYCYYLKKHIIYQICKGSKYDSG